MLAAALLFGAITGLALGLTGGGGTLLALPLLMHGLGLPAHDAAAVALLAVGAMALSGALVRLRAHQLQWHLGMWFAVAGIAGAPLGSVIAHHLPALALIVGYAALTLLVAWRMWTRTAGPLSTDSQPLPPESLVFAPACRISPGGRVRLTSRCLVMLVPAGLLTGVISGMFGVGGGFVVVPALVLIAGIDIRQATATSLLVVAMVSLSGALAAFAGGIRVDPWLTATFAAAGILGLEAGSRYGRRLPAQLMQRGFAVALVAVAVVLILIPILKRGPP